MLLDAWGEDFLAHGELDVRFVGMVLAGDDDRVTRSTIDDDAATIDVENVTTARAAVVGSARRHARQPE